MASKTETKITPLSDIPIDFFKSAYGRGVFDKRRAWYRENQIIDWTRAACRNCFDPNLFFPSRGEDDKIARAKSICNQCPIKDLCLVFALTTGEEIGIWGGTSGRDRRSKRVKLLKELVSKR